MFWVVNAPITNPIINPKIPRSVKYSGNASKKKHKGIELPKPIPEHKIPFSTQFSE